MADEELSPAQKLALGSNFILNSPPAQVHVVVDGERAAPVFHLIKLSAACPNGLPCLRSLPPALYNRC